MNLIWMSMKKNKKLKIINSKKKIRKKKGGFENTLTIEGIRKVETNTNEKRDMRWEI